MFPIDTDAAMNQQRRAKKSQPTKTCNCITAVESDCDDEIYSLLDLSEHEHNNLIITNALSSGSNNQGISQQAPLDQVLSCESKREGERPTKRCSEIEVSIVRRDSLVSTVTFAEIEPHLNTDDVNSVSTRREGFRIERRRSISFNEKVDRLIYDGDSWTETSEVLTSQTGQIDSTCKKNQVCSSALPEEDPNRPEKKSMKGFQKFCKRVKKKKCSQQPSI